MITDREIVEGLLKRDSRVTYLFLHVKCRPLLTAVIRNVFRYQVDYDEMVNELYLYIMDNDGCKLREFQYRSSLFQWLKVVSLRFFIQIRDRVIENESKDPLYNQTGTPQDAAEVDNSHESQADCMDVERLLGMMDNPRYVDVIRRLILEDKDPVEYAAILGVTVANLYNIKKRAMAALTQLAVKHYKYGR